MTKQLPKVGIGVIVLKEGKVLLGKRKGSHGEGEYAFPGGHLEYMESFEECALREVKEETGMEIKNIRFLLVMNNRSHKPKHYVHLTLIADWVSGEAKTLEPAKCEDWGWYNLQSLPSPLFDFCELSFKALKTNQNYFDD